MKIVIVTPYFYPHPGGVESYTLNIARQLRTLGWEVVLVSTSTEHLGTVIEDFEGMKIYYLRADRVVSNTPLGWRWRRELKAIFRTEKPDVINAHTPVPYLADIAQRASGSIPFVLTYHNDLQKDNWPYKGIVEVLNRTIISRTLKRSTAIIATSEYYAAKSRFLKPYHHKLSIVPPGVDQQRFNPQVPFAALKKRYEGQRVVLFVGSLNKAQQHKGLDKLIQAFARLHATHADARLVAVGAGDAIADYQAQAEAAGVGSAVELTGRIEDEVLAQYYRLATVFAMPSTNNNEGFGMVYMEASATSTPVIGTKVGGVPYAVLDNQTGLLVEPNNVDQLAKALQTVFDDRTLAQRLGRAGAKRAAAEFDWQQLAKRTDVALRRAIKPTILQVAGYYPPHLGGMERVAQSLSEQLARRDYAVRVLTSAVNGEAGTMKAADNLYVSRFKAREFAHTPFAFSFIPAIFRTPRHAIIHLHLAQAFYPELVWLAAKLRRIPYVVHFHLDLQPSGPLGLVFLAYKAVVIRAVIRQADGVVVFSPDQKAFIHATYHVPESKISVIPNGVGQEYFLPARQYGKKKSALELLYVGRLAPQKRCHLLLEAVAALQLPVKLTIVGDGEDRAALEALAEQLQLQNVTFTGQKLPHEALPYYRQADVFVIASEREGMPLVLLEAMAAGLPIVGTDVDGIRELLQTNGVLVPSNDPAAFAETLTNLLQDPQRLQELSQANRETARSYSWDRLTDAFEALYERLSA